MGRAIGIDLGTTFSVVACVNSDGRPEALRDSAGQTAIPSVVLLGGAAPVVGMDAKERQALGDSDVAAFFKRHMGEPEFALTVGGRSYSAVDLSALVLGHMKSIAEQALGSAVTDAVITVPAYFNNAEREATLRAGRAAGLNVLSIINEPTAAALAFGMRPQSGGGTIMVFDLGGGTFDVTVARLETDQVRVLGTDGDHRLGGKDWDDAILRYVGEQFQEEYETDLFANEFARLLPLAEGAKKTLSVKQSVSITVDSSGHRGTYTLTREQFTDLTRDLMERTQALSESLLREIGLQWADLSAVLLVGGSTRMPMVGEWLEKISGKAPLRGVNPDEAVALGAAVQACLDVAARDGAVPLLGAGGRRRVLDVMSHSLGMIALDETGERYLNSIIIRKNLAVPASHTRPYRIRLRRGEPVTLEAFVTQGESDEPLQCAYLGWYVFTGEPAKDSGEAIVDVSYAYDRNGVVEASAVQRTTGKPLTLSIKPLPEDVPARFGKPPVRTRAVEFLTVYLAFDLSGSMVGTPLAEAQRAAHEFLSQCDLGNMAVGLIAFSDQSRVTLAASQNARKISKGIDALEAGLTGGGNAGDPFEVIYDSLKRVKRRRHAIVLADGVWDHQALAIKRAQRCHQAEISVLGVGFGGADKEFLRKISFPADASIFTSLESLVDTFSSIAQELNEGGTRLVAG